MPPAGTPEQTMALKTPRRSLGANSAMIGPAVAMTRPRPRPKVKTVPVRAVMAMPLENQAMPIMSMRLRPRMSPMNPEANDPSSTPIRASDPTVPAMDGSSGPICEGSFRRVGITVPNTTRS